MTTARQAARLTGLIAHTSRCRSSGLGSCVCDFERRLSDLAARFEAYGDGRVRELEEAERIVNEGLSGQFGVPECPLIERVPRIRWFQEDGEPHFAAREDL